MKFPRNSKLLEYAKDLRKNMTKEERKLWYNYLRDNKCKFRRQEIIGNYIIDFFSYELNLGIEIDGTQHYTELVDKDKERTRFLNSLNIEIIRFSNNEINFEFDNVCESIHAFIEQLKS